MSVSSKVSGSFKTEAFLKKAISVDLSTTLERYGKAGVDALAAATPYGEGTTAAAWTYEIVRDGKSTSIIWSNTNVVGGRPIAVLLQYGHATRNGGYVPGRDYINPAMKSLFQKMSDDGWKVVTGA